VDDGQEMAQVASFAPRQQLAGGDDLDEFNEKYSGRVDTRISPAFCRCSTPATP